MTDTSAKNWWRGNANGRLGKFPKTYVRLLSDEITAVALKPLDDGRKGHVRMRKGDRLIVLNKIADSEWWEVLNESLGGLGIAPAKFLAVDTNVELFDELNQV